MPSLLSRLHLFFARSWKTRKLIWFIGGFAYLALVFYSNYYSSRGSEPFHYWRHGFQVDSENLTFYDVDRSIADRVSENAGLMGKIGKPYFSQMGVQGLVYQVACKAAPNTETCRPVLKAFNIVLVSLLLVAFAFLATSGSDYRAWMFILFLFSVSDWLVLFSDNLYWLYELQVLPFIVCWWLAPRYLSGEIEKWKFYLAIGFAVALKSATGYEYISCTIASLSIPLLYFSLQQPNLRASVFLKSLKEMAFSFAIGVSAFVAVFALNGLQNSLVFSRRPGESFDMRNIKLGYSSILSRALTRVAGDAITETKNSEQDMVAGQPVPEHKNEPILPMLNGYFKWPYMTVRPPLQTPQYLNLYFVLLLMGSGLVLTRKLWRRNLIRARAFFMTLPFAFLASLSWLILAVPHSIVHIAINPIVFYIPFLLFLFTWPSLLFVHEPRGDSQPGRP
jgi:hypothetical protein